LSRIELLALKEECTSFGGISKILSFCYPPLNHAHFKKKIEKSQSTR
jgi:hypothetical protein